MKKSIVRIFAVALVAIMVCLAFAACAKTLSGKYSAQLGSTSIAGTKTTYEFSGKKVTITNVSGVAGFEKTTTFEGTYKIDGDEITFTFEDDDASSYNQTVSFEETEDGVKIAGIEYKKEK